MIIFAPGPKTLVDFLKLETILEGPSDCPCCGRSLWKHGSRFRRCESLQLCARLEIPRLFCFRCRKTFSVLPTFLEPLVRFERSVGEKYVSDFVSGEASYCELAWGDDDGDRDDAAASVSRAFRAVSKAAIEASRNLMALHQNMLQPGLALNLQSLNIHSILPARQIKSEQKRLQIEALRVLFALLGQRCADDQSAICDAYRTLRLGFRLPTPHSLQYALF
jgi:hypothetical protein